MKKVILTAVIALSTVFGISNTTFAGTPGKGEVSTELSNIKAIREIEVHGNVKVYLTNSENTDKVKVYGNYYAQNALVQEDDNVLRITSYSAQPLVVYITVNNLNKLTAFDNAQVQSIGKFGALDLTINLYNRAAAQLDMDAFNATVTLNDRASATLTGYIENGNLRYNRMASLTTGNLTTASLVQTISQRPMKHFFHHNGPGSILRINDLSYAVTSNSI